MIYVLDTNVISDLLTRQPQVTQHVEEHRLKRDMMVMCQPVYYELMRGLIRTKAARKLEILNSRIISKFNWESLINADWLQAAHFWSTAISAGRQLSDMDFLIAALAQRLNATIVSADTDFDALPVSREDWRTPAP